MGIRIKDFKILLLFIFLSACGKTYFYYTDLHHLDSKIIISKHKVRKTTRAPYSTYTKNYSRDSLEKINELEFLENGKVVRFGEKYYIRKGVTDTCILTKYCNKDLKF